MSQPVCLVSGAGDGTGAAIARRFASGDYRAPSHSCGLDSIDAAIDTPWTRPHLYPNKPDEFFAKPSAIADTVYHVAHQDRSAWTFNVDVRPYQENW